MTPFVYSCLPTRRTVCSILFSSVHSISIVGSWSPASKKVKTGGFISGTHDFIEEAVLVRSLMHERPYKRIVLEVKHPHEYSLDENQ